MTDDQISKAAAPSPKVWHEVITQHLNALKPKMREVIERGLAEPVEIDLTGSKQWLKHMRVQNAKFICTIEWSWSPVNERKESYYLQRGRKHWLLWRKDYDDNWGRWEKPIAVARCFWKGLPDNKERQ